MSKDERILIFMSVAALIAALAWKFRAALVGASSEGEGEYVTNLTYNQPSFMGSGVANVLPQGAASSLGVPLNDGSYYSSSCGCF